MLKKAGLDRLRGLKSDGRSTSERIVDAAFNCFTTRGIERTTIADIADMANVSRTSVYNHFGSFDDIVFELVVRESRRVNAQIKEAIVDEASVDEALTNGMLRLVRICEQNQYTRALLSNIDVASQSADPKSRIYETQQERWAWLLFPAMERSAIARDLELDDIISWLTLSLDLLMIKIAVVDFSDDQLKKFIARFIIKPLLPDPS